MSHSILLVEDSSDVRLILTDLLNGSHYEVVAAEDGRSGLQRAFARPFDLVILDVMLPDIDGLEFCRTLRERGFDCGILMLTARAQVDDRIVGLSVGADDYLIKPFDPREVLARVEALLRRTHKLELTPVTNYEFGEISVNFESRTVLRGGVTVNLTSRELKLLRHLINHRERTVSREDLLANVWEDQKFIGPRTVDVHIAWLRQKLEADPGSPRHFLTVRSKGYKFVR
jgi:two-component system, OmpR family, alkaline phosphatase synthesis response regulator PhoP